MSLTAIIVARQGSSRLPGKALAKIMGKPVISLIIERLKNIPEINNICLATSNLEIDIPLIELAKKHSIMTYAGHPEDVLDRLYHAAKSSKAEIIFDVGGDCPLVDQQTLNKGLMLMQKERYDFVHNFAPSTYPDGLDCPLMTFDCLERVHLNSSLSSHRRHPFSYIFTYSDQFSIGNFSYI